MKRLYETEYVTITDENGAVSRSPKMIEGDHIWWTIRYALNGNPVIQMDTDDAQHTDMLAIEGVSEAVPTQ